VEWQRARIAVSLGCFFPQNIFERASDECWYYIRWRLEERLMDIAIAVHESSDSSACCVKTGGNGQDPPKEVA
jgi:hypothetical protein